jgi:ABC-type uncharacterized transport system substrate-binding protein
MLRRRFITLFSSVVSWPLAAHAKQEALAEIGFVGSRSAASSARSLAALRRGLSERGYDEGRNVVIQYRWAEGQYDRLRELAADLVRHDVALIIAGGVPAAAAAKAATTTIPILFVSGLDPVKVGLVQSFSHPGGSITGVYMLLGMLVAKRLELLRDLVPKIDVLGALLNPKNPNFEVQVTEIRQAAQAVGQRIKVVHATTEADLDRSFAMLAQAKASALLTGADPFFLTRRSQIVALAARYAIPTIYELSEFAAAGGLVSYGPSLTDAYRQTGLYAGRILNGEKAAQLPVMQSSRFELLINLKTARALGLVVPQLLLARADEVLE